MPRVDTRFVPARDDDGDAQISQGACYPVPIPRLPPVTTATEPGSPDVLGECMTGTSLKLYFPERLPPAYNRLVRNSVLQHRRNARIAQMCRLLALGKIPTYNPPLRTLVLFSHRVGVGCGRKNALITHIWRM